MTVAEKHSHLFAALSSIPDRQECLTAIVDRGTRGIPYPIRLKTPAHRVPGCVSPVWLSSGRAGDQLTFQADAEAPVVRGLVRLLCELYDGALPADIAATEPTLLEELDLLRDLSPTRRNGLEAVRARIRDLAQRPLATP